MQLGYLYINRIIRYHKHPRKIINNRDKLFILFYWNILITAFKIKFKILMVYHPQTDSQTEQIN